VEKIDPGLVVRDENGNVNTVRYDQVNAMLLNEFLKEHRKNEEQEVTIACLRKEVEALTAGLQKVSAQLELSKPAAQTAHVQTASHWESGNDKWSRIFASLVVTDGRSLSHLVDTNLSWHDLVLSEMF
jgi:hypothetical protein